jgi:hypothetical protein
MLQNFLLEVRLTKFILVAIFFSESQDPYLVEFQFSFFFVLYSLGIGSLPSHRFGLSFAWALPVSVGPAIVSC